MIAETNKDKGRAGLAIAIGYYGSNGYTVSIPLNDTQDYDIIVDKGDGLKKVQVKCTGCTTERGAFVCFLTSSGGTSGKVYKRVVDTDIDLLFVVCTNGWLFEIPKDKLNQRKSVTLRDKPSPYNNTEEDYSKYLVSLDIITPVSIYSPVIRPREKIKPKVPKIPRLINRCVDCGKPIRKTSKRCKDCYMKNAKHRAYKCIKGRPTHDKLKELLDKGTPFTTIGNMYGISDNAIRKWCKKFGLPATRVEIALQKQNL